MPETQEGLFCDCCKAETWKTELGLCPACVSKLLRMHGHASVDVSELNRMLEEKIQDHFKIHQELADVDHHLQLACDAYGYKPPTALLRACFLAGVAYGSSSDA